MKTILGLDLGTNSIGWSLINQDFENKKGEIIGIGSRILPMSQEILGEFDKGNSVSQTAARTKFRSTRRLRERHLLRRERLHRVLNIINFLPTHFSSQLDKYGNFSKNTEPKLAYFLNSEKKHEFLFKNSYNEMLNDFKVLQPTLLTNKFGQPANIPFDWTIYYLRKKALTQKIEKEELAWLLLHFNQKRGYYQLRGEEEEIKENKTEEFYNLKVIEVEAKEKGKREGEIWYNVTLENGWIYRRASNIPLFDWKDKNRDFIVSTDINEDGSIKIDKDGKEKRSFRAPKEDDWGLLKKKTENDITKSNKTVGEFIYDSLLQMPNQKIKGKLVRTIERKFYKQELKQIIEKQSSFHKELQDEKLYKLCIEVLYESNTDYRNSIATRDFQYLLLDNIIFYQRPLKSKKSEISNCSFESRKYTNNDGIEIIEPLKCVSRSHPLFQEFRLWQWIQNIKIYEREKPINGKSYTDVDVTNEFLKSQNDYVSLFDFLNSKKDITQKSFLGHFLKSKEVNKYRWNFIDDDKKTYPCNETRTQLLTRLNKVENIDDDFLTQEKELELWHILYSITDKIETEKALIKFATKNNLPVEEFSAQLLKYPLIKSEYGAYSLKAIKKLLPLMRMGKYWDANEIHPYTMSRIEKIINAEYDETIKDRVREKAIQLTTIEDFSALPLWLVSYIVYDRHSEASDLTKWNTPAELTNYLNQFKQHSLRNPIVEQVITETLRVVKDIWNYYGDGKENFLDEIHIELGREMKNNAADRKSITDNNNKNQATNLRIKTLLVEFSKPEYGIENVRPYSPSQQDILKIYEDSVLNSGIEIPEEIMKISKSSQPTDKEILKYKLWIEQKYRSPYTGQIIPLSKLFTPDFEIEHIIPQSIYFDDSFSNKVICESEINKLKTNQFGYEFIAKHGSEIITLNKGAQVKIFTKDEYEDFIKLNYANNRGKMKKLLLEDVPEKMIERQLNDTRYISKFIKTLLSNIVRAKSQDDGVTSKNILSSNGNITGILKQDWGLNDVWNDLITPRFERLNKLTNSENFGTWTNKGGNRVFQTQVPLELQKGFNKKRIDHRHHAMDALIIACATRNHINYLNNQNALDKTKKKSNDEKQKDRHDLKHLLCIKTKTDNNGNYKWQFSKPWQTLTQDAKAKLETTIISFKQNLRVINKSVNYYQKFVDGQKMFVKQTQGDNWAIRKELHKQTVSGRILLDRIKIPKGKILTATRKSLDTSYDDKTIEKITDIGIQKILLNFLKTKENNPEIAFTPEGIEEMNNNISNYNEGKNHFPINKFRVFEISSRFALGETGNKKNKFVEAAQGTNLFFAVYASPDGLRAFDTIPFNLAVERLKQGLLPVPNKENYNLLFWLSPNDLVYFPNDEEIDSNIHVNFNNLNSEQIKRIFNVNDFSSAIYFKPNSLAKNIMPKEVDLNWDTKKLKLIGSFDTKTASFEGKQIKDICWKLEIDRIGNIIKVTK
jgi:CRISPR-associated endonuclease Csn1